MSWQPKCGMKTLTDGYFYIPNLNVHTLKIDLLFRDDVLESDQMGGESPYPTMPYFPDGKVDVRDLIFVGSYHGKKEGDPDWEHMADVVPDRKIDDADLNVVQKNLGSYGEYITDLSGVTVIFDTGEVAEPNENGYVRIPQKAKSFHLKKNEVAIGGLVTFYEEELPRTTTEMIMETISTLFSFMSMFMMMMMFMAFFRAFLKIMEKR